MEAASPAVAAPMPQHLIALANANRVRLARAKLKRAIAAGDATAATVLRECPPDVRTMTVGELLRSQRRWGRARVRKFLVTLPLSENRRLGHLTARQRTVLVSALECKAAH